MPFLPLTRMWDRIEIGRQASDTDLFMYLMYAGELLTKLVALGLIAAVSDENDRHRYRQVHRLVRADGLGDWVTSIDEVLVGPSAHHLAEAARDEQRELSQKVTPGTWQYDAALSLDACLRRLDNAREGFPFKVEGRRCFSLFSELRNRTRGHGAISSGAASLICPDLEKALLLIYRNFALFQRQWAFLHRNLSGKYRVTKLVDLSTQFDELKSSQSAGLWGSLPDGVYVFFERPYRAELVLSDADATDFHFPNGRFDGKRFELISYLTDDRMQADAAPYLPPAGRLPNSETQGIGTLWTCPHF
jgi:hypothetical protein